MKTNTAGLAIALVAVSILSGCEKQGDERLQEKSRIEGAAQTEEQIKQEQDLFRSKVSTMENELASRHEFYETNGGHFEGTMSRSGESFKIRISLFPNLSRYQGDRVRSLAEVEQDLISLSYNAQVVQWDARNPLSSVGCRFEGLRPDLVTGRITMISSECASTYFLVLQRTAINGTAQPSSNPEKFEVYVTKTSGTAVERRTP